MLFRIEFPLKKLDGRVFLSLIGVELGGAKDLLFLKFDIFLEWENKSYLGLSTAKNIDYI